MSLSATTIATAIAALSVTGVTILDLDKIPVEALASKCPVLMPDVSAWGGAAAAQYLTFGAAASRYIECVRELGYVYFHAPVGPEPTPAIYFKGMSDKRDLLIEALLELNTANVDVMTVTTGPFQIQFDLAGNRYHGFDLKVQVREKANN